MKIIIENTNNAVQSAAGKPGQPNCPAETKLLINGTPPLLLTNNSSLPLISLTASAETEVQSVKDQSAIVHHCHKSNSCGAPKPNGTDCPVCRFTASYAKLMSDRKLSPAGWQKLRQMLGLPKNIEEISIAKAIGAIHLLHNFSRTFSIAEQNQISAEKIVGWLTQIPNLPKVFAKTVTKLKQHFGTPPANPKDDSQSSLPAKNQPENLTKRRAVGPQIFTEVAVRQGMFCYWCGVRVVRESQIPPARRMKKSENRILYYLGEELREDALATIDHLVRVSDGGTNEPVNLVISCQECNFAREKVTVAYNRPFTRQRLPCPNCGGRFFYPDWGCCSICGASPQSKTMSSNQKGFRKIISQLLNLVKFF
jgi:hypothetical protein